MKNKLFIGIDIGGTKISAGLVDSSGRILAREKLSTPEKANPRRIIGIIEKLIAALLKQAKQTPGALCGIGIGVPGIVDTRTETIKKTVNINLSGFNITQALQTKFHCGAAAGNDVDLGILGEQWLGAARGTANVIGVFPGTGVGGGIIINNTLVRGASGAAGEIGHMIMQIDGPVCSCGNRGCLEALASRWALERDLRAAIKTGEKSIITRLTGNNLSVIKSKIIQQALREKDPLTVRLMTRIAEILGQACINLRHIFDPDMILFGGGLIEACADFILPKVKKAVRNDPFFGPISNCAVVASSLGDDAVILGAVALLRKKTEDFPSPSLPPRCDIINNEIVAIEGKNYSGDTYIRANGSIKHRGKKAMKTPGVLSPDEVKKICRKKTKVLIIGANKNKPLRILPETKSFLTEHRIRLITLPLEEALRKYRQSTRPAALLLRLA